MFSLTSLIKKDVQRKQQQRFGRRVDCSRWTEPGIVGLATSRLFNPSLHNPPNLQRRDVTGFASELLLDTFPGKLSGHSISAFDLRNDIRRLQIKPDKTALSCGLCMFGTSEEHLSQQTLPRRRLGTGIGCRLRQLVRHLRTFEATTARTVDSDSKNDIRVLRQRERRQFVFESVSRGMASS